MRKRSSNDINQIAAQVIESITGKKRVKSEPRKRKNPAAVQLGRRGGKKGGPARAAALSDEQRSEIARIAAMARWKKIANS